LANIRAPNTALSNKSIPLQTLAASKLLAKEQFLHKQQNNGHSKISVNPSTNSERTLTSKGPKLKLMYITIKNTELRYFLLSCKTSIFQSFIVE